MLPTTQYLLSVYVHMRKNEINIMVFMVNFVPFLQFFNPLTPGAFCQKCIFWTFWWFSDWISAKLALTRAKRHLQHNSLPFLPLALRFTTSWLRRFFFLLSFFSFFSLFAAVIDLLLDLLSVKKLLRERHQDGQFLPWSSQVQWQEILL